LYQNHLYYAN